MHVLHGAFTVGSWPSLEVTYWKDTTLHGQTHNLIKVKYSYKHSNFKSQWRCLPQGIWTQLSIILTNLLCFQSSTFDKTVYIEKPTKFYSFSKQKIDCKWSELRELSIKQTHEQIRCWNPWHNIAQGISSAITSSPLPSSFVCRREYAGMQWYLLAILSHRGPSAAWDQWNDPNKRTDEFSHLLINWNSTQEAISQNRLMSLTYKWKHHPTKQQPDNLGFTEMRPTWTELYTIIQKTLTFRLSFCTMHSNARLATLWQRSFVNKGPHGYF